MVSKLKIRTPFSHRENYGPFNKLLDCPMLPATMVLHASDINNMTYDYYLKCITNFMVDGIETPIWHGLGKVDVIFADNVRCTLTINDLLFNIIMWYVAVSVNEPITSRFLFWDRSITNNNITNYINRNFLNDNEYKCNNKFLNNVIADCTGNYSIIDKVSKYLSDTVNLYDDVVLMSKSKEYYDALHLDISNSPLDKHKEIIDEATNIAIDNIKNSKKYLGYDHSLASNFISGEALNKKQFSEVYISIGTKPDANGEVIPHIINNGFINGGLEDYRERYIESYASIEATIESHVSVSKSGDFARKLILLNSPSRLNRDPHRFCNTRNFEHITIDCENTLCRLDKRYYKLIPNGVTYRLSKNDKSLIGKSIYLYSPMTCADYAAGRGVCYRCYGDLAYVNCDINIGTFAAELLSNMFTQRKLSTKHILATNISKIEWVPEFEEFFYVEIDRIMFDKAKYQSGFSIIINTDDIQNDEIDEDSDEDDVEEDNDFFSPNYDTGYYVSEFILKCPDGNTISIHSKSYNKLYFSKELYDYITYKNSDNEASTISVNMNDIEGSLFSVMVENTSLNKALPDITNIIDKTNVTSSMDKDQILQEFISALNASNIKMNSVHAEILLSNQIRSSENIYEIPAWQYKDPGYTILSLRQALNNNPSVAISLSYQNIKKQFNSASTYDKNKPSIFDLNFEINPQPYMDQDIIVKDKDEDTDYITADYASQPKLINPFVVLDNDK